MRVVEALLGRLRRTRRNDPVFGSMLYMGDRVKYWECKVAFPPTSSVVEAYVDGSAEDSMELQHKFFDQFVQKWPNLSETIGEMLLKEWRERKPNVPTESPWDVFKLSSLSIPSASIDVAKWEISFVTLEDPNHLWTVQMAGSHPQHLTVEG